MNWQTIDTAPKDGSDVLVITRGGSIWIARTWGGVWQRQDGQTVYSNPTHWMPLPEPPAQAIPDKTEGQTNG